MERKATVGRKPRRAQGVHLCHVVQRAGFEPRCWTIVAQEVRKFDVPFVPIVSEFQTPSRGSNPARLTVSSWRNHGRAEIFALPILRPRLADLY
jgi:hypothetical protein